MDSLIKALTLHTLANTHKIEHTMAHPEKYITMLRPDIRTLDREAHPRRETTLPLAEEDPLHGLPELFKEKNPAGLPKILGPDSIRKRLRAMELDTEDFILLRDALHTPGTKRPSRKTYTL